MRSPKAKAQHTCSKHCSALRDLVSGHLIREVSRTWGSLKGHPDIKSIEKHRNLRAFDPQGDFSTLRTKIHGRPHTVEAGKLEHFYPPTPNLRKQEHQHESSNFHVPTFWNLPCIVHFGLKNPYICHVLRRLPGGSNVVPFLALWPPKYPTSWP